MAVPNPATAHQPRTESVFSEFPASFILIRHPEAGYILYDAVSYTHLLPPVNAAPPSSATAIERVW